VADTRVQHEVEDWVRSEWMPKEYGQSFERERLVLESGGEHGFAAVSTDRTIAATICTGGAKTAGGNFASGKVMKLRSDMLFLTMVGASRRLIVLTEDDTYELCLREREAGRVPAGIEFAHVTIPPALQKRLVVARGISSRESSPGPA